MNLVPVACAFIAVCIAAFTAYVAWQSRKLLVKVRILEVVHRAMLVEEVHFALIREGRVDDGVSDTIVDALLRLVPDEEES